MSTLDKLRRATIIARIECRAQGLDKAGHPHKGRIKNFLTVGKRPREITRFKRLPIAERAKVIATAKDMLLSCKQIKTAQTNVIKANLKHFFRNPQLCAKAIEHTHYGKQTPLVVITASGLWMYDGNHRANIRYLLKKKIRCRVFDLRYLSKPGDEK